MQVFNNTNQTIDLNKTKLVIQINDQDVKPTNKNDEYTNVVEFNSSDKDIIFQDENGNDTNVANIVEQELSNGEKQKVSIIQVINKNNTQLNDLKEIQVQIQEHKNEDGDNHSNNIAIKDSETINLTFGKQGIFVENVGTTFAYCTIDPYQSQTLDLFINLKDDQKI